MKSRWVVWLRRFVSILAVGLFVIVFTKSGFDLPPRLTVRFALASTCSIVGLMCAAIGWSELAGVSWRIGFVSFGTSLPLRHLPLGGLGQLAGLAGLTATQGIGRKRASQAGSAFLLTTAGGASIVAIPQTWDGATPLPVRVAVGAAAVGTAIALLAGPRLLTLIGRRWTMFAGMETLPLLRSTIWSTLAAIGAGSAFAILFTNGGSFERAMSGFSAAWLGGFLFVVAPAGLGAREAIMVSIWPAVGPEAIFSASLIHRISTLVGEGVMLIIGLMMARSARRRSSERS